MEWSKAIGYARDVKLLLQPCCDRIEIAGSLRRLRSEVHDIEIVTKPKMDPFDQLQMRIADMVSHHRLYPGSCSKDMKKAPMGPRYYRLNLSITESNWLQLDVFSVMPPADFGIIYAIRTGSAEFSHWLVTEALRKGMRVQDGQLWKWEPPGQALMLQERVKIPCPEEQDLFTALGLDWIPPTGREAPPVVAEAARGSTNSSRGALSRMGPSF